ncbi:transcriptional regulator [Candidatus Fermentibacteria bacterium]|nr:MAG: transcriptional regulator [Candidatus Fermentibacteria bacterium]
MQELFPKIISEQNGVYTAFVMAGRPPSKEAPTFGQNLAAARRARGLTQPQLADMLDMTVKGIDYYERRAANPNSEFVRRSAKVLKVSVAELIGEEPSLEKQRPGPAPKLKRQIDQIQTLSRSKQKFVSELLDTVLKSEATS